jgi:hypothetical protein
LEERSLDPRDLGAGVLCNVAMYCGDVSSGARGKRIHSRREHPGHLYLPGMQLVG